MGAGKSTVGRVLAQLMHAEFIDSDGEIERRTGADIPWIFEIEGEDGFRTRESQVIAELCSRSGVVVATGGGAVMREENRDWLCGLLEGNRQRASSSHGQRQQAAPISRQESIPSPFRFVRPPRPTV
jgi:predicted kinase